MAHFGWRRRWFILLWVVTVTGILACFGGDEGGGPVMDDVVGVILIGEGDRGAIWVTSGGIEDGGKTESEPETDRLVSAQGVAGWEQGVRGPNPMPGARKAATEHRLVWDSTNPGDGKGRIRVTTATDIGSDMIVFEVDDVGAEGRGVIRVNDAPVADGRAVSRVEIWRSRTRGSRDSVEVEVAGVGRW